MFWQHLWSYFTGYVVITVTGRSVEKFINMALSRGIYLWDIAWVDQSMLILNVRVYAVFALRHIARKTGCRFKIRAKKGLPFMAAKLRRRKMLLAGAAFFILMLYVYSSFIWTVEVRGVKKLKKERIVAAAKAAGIKPGLLKWNFDKEPAKKQIAGRIEEIAWLEIYIEGTRAVIEVSEKIYPPKGAEEGPAHIVAAKDGMVKGILVMSGQSLVKEGDTVEKGQVLISGAIMPQQEKQEGEEQSPPRPQGKITYLRAKGTVKARVWYETYAEQEFVDAQKGMTGRSKSFIYIKIGQKEIILKGSPNSPYRYYKKEVKVKRPPVWRNITVPVEIVTTIFREQEVRRQVLTMAEAKQKALEKARARLARLIPSGAKRFPLTVEIIHAGREKFIRLRVMVEAEEDIGVALPFPLPEERGGSDRIGRRSGSEVSP